MKPLRLTMQAFGPFAGTESIQFADLGEAPLFLINGPTGSGKTTILDAICYALYGSTTGNEREAREMRCQQSDPNLLTKVIFEFSLKGASYHIVRSPDQSRPKQRGQGMTQDLGRADLYQLGPDGTIETGELLVEKKVSDATEYIRRITGMNAEQFRQVMVLPQGQFRKLLMADSKEKQKIFESLFETMLYTRIEERLKEESREIREAVAHGDAVIRNILETGGVNNPAELAGQIDSVAAQLATATEAKVHAEQIWQKSARDLEEANKLNTDFATLEEVKTRQAHLLNQARRIDADRDRVKQSRAAEKIKHLHDRVREAQASVQNAIQDVQAAGQVLVEAEAAREKADAHFQAENARGAERLAAAAEVHRLQSYAGKVEALVAAKTDWAAATAKEQRSHAAVEQHKATLAGLEAREPQLRSNIAALEKAITGAGGIELRIHKLKEALAARKTLSDVEANIAKTEQALVQARDVLATTETARDKADKALKRLRQIWHQGQAAILAQELEEGSACPVCGSLEHPSPATQREQTVSETDLEDAAVQCEERTQAVIAANGKVTTFAERVAALQAQSAALALELGEELPPSALDIQNQLDNAMAGQLALARDQQQLATEKQSLQELGAAMAACRREAEHAATALADVKSATGAARTRVELAEQELPDGFREVGQLEQKLAEATAASTLLDSQLERSRTAFERADKAKGEAQVSLAGLQRQSDAFKAQLDSASSTWTEALASSVFATEQEMALALMPESAMRELEQQVNAYDVAVTEVKATRNTLEAQLTGKQRGDVATLQADESRNRTERDAHLAAWRSVDQHMTRLHDTRTNLEAKQLEKAALDAKYRVVGTLADVACGLKGSKISLQRYVLGVLLDDVLVQSTQRLMKMSDGRYELRRKLDPGRGNRASGLELEVYDDYSGESRSVATLSGGESFMAALSLALGLSDVVQAQTGGIQLDTLFVDEGFGTLDSEALELAVATLIDLQRSGRMVGIISHVSELREQMDVRIDLSKCSQGGSRLKIVSPMALS